jgi:hypothetical protein
MFQISATPAPKAVVSALTVLAAMGASGMVSAAPIELDPSMGTFCVNNWGMNTAANMKDWLTANTITYHSQGPAFAKWNIDFASNNVASAQYRIDANGNGSSYGIPSGAVLTFSLVTQNWATGVAAAQGTGPLYGTTQGVDFLQFTSASSNGDANYDITPLLQTWDANPGSYYGVRFFITGGATRGGVRSPDQSGSFTGNLVVDMTPIPEPTALALAGAGRLLAVRRRRH